MFAISWLNKKWVTFGNNCIHRNDPPPQKNQAKNDSNKGTNDTNYSFKWKIYFLSRFHISRV